MRIPLDGVEYEIDWAWTSHGSPTTYSPRFGAEGGDAPEVEIVREAELDGKTVLLTDDQLEAAEAWIFQNVEPDPYDYDDYDV